MEIFLNEKWKYYKIFKKLYNLYSNKHGFNEEDVSYEEFAVYLLSIIVCDDFDNFEDYDQFIKSSKHEFLIDIDEANSTIDKLSN